MRVGVDGVRLFFDVDGTKLVAEGPWMRERPTVLLLPPGPGFDHALFKIRLGPWLAAGTQVVYLDFRGSGRSDAGRPEDYRVERWADDVRGLCDALAIERPVVVGYGTGAMVALDYAARNPEHPAGLVLSGVVARIVPERSIAVYERLGGAEARAVAERFYSGAVDEAAFAGFLRVLFPLLSTFPLTGDVIARADWSPQVLTGWMAGEALTLDLRDRLGAIRAPALVLSGEDDAWAPIESAREVADGLGGPVRFRSYPGARHSIIQDVPQAFEDLRVFLDDVQEAAGR